MYYKFLGILLSAVVAPALVFAQPIANSSTEPCWTAILGTLAHFAVGDGAGLGCEVEFYGGDDSEVPPAGGIYCNVPNNSGVRCDFYGEYCSQSSTESDPHNWPGGAICFQGCGAVSGFPITMTINQAKCCLTTGQMTGPNCPN